MVSVSEFGVGGVESVQTIKMMKPPTSSRGEKPPAQMRVYKPLLKPKAEANRPAILPTLFLKFFMLVKRATSYNPQLP